jgi:CRP/FNR family transcriptional regulator, cAMP and macrophage regulator
VWLDDRSPRDPEGQVPTPLQDAAWMARCVGRGVLSPFSEPEMAELGRVVGVRRVVAGAPLMAEAEPISAVGLVRHGTVELTRRQGMRRVVLQVLQPGDLYGDIPFLCHMPPPFNARALTDAEVIEISADRFWALLESRPELCQRFLFSVASRLQRTQQRLLELTSGDLRHQVASLLLGEAAGTGSVPLSQATLAALLGASRSNVNRTLKDLEAQGAVRLAYRSIEIVDPTVLRAVLA